MQEVSKLVGDFMDPHGESSFLFLLNVSCPGKNSENWEKIRDDNNEAGAHSIRSSLEDYVEKALLYRCRTVSLQP